MDEKTLDIFPGKKCLTCFKKKRNRKMILEKGVLPVFIDGKKFENSLPKNVVCLSLRASIRMPRKYKQ